MSERPRKLLDERMAARLGTTELARDLNTVNPMLDRAEAERDEALAKLASIREWAEAMKLDSIEPMLRDAGENILSLLETDPPEQEGYDEHNLEQVAHHLYDALKMTNTDDDPLTKGALKAYRDFHGQAKRCPTCGCPDPKHLNHGRSPSQGPCPDEFHRGDGG